MDNYLVPLLIDGVLLIILLVGYVIGAKRGLFKSLMGVVVVIAAIVGSMFAADLLTEPVTEFIMPKVEEKVTEWLSVPEELTMGQFFSGTASSNSVTNPTFSEWFGKLDKWGAGDRFVGEIKESTATAAQTAARSLVESIVHSILMLLCFAILLIVLKLLVRTMDHVFDLPVLKTLNDVGGGILGLIEMLLLAYLVLWLTPRIGITFFRDHAEETYLLKFLTEYTPLTLIASLNGGN